MTKEDKKRQSKDEEANKNNEEQNIEEEKQAETVNQQEEQEQPSGKEQEQEQEEKQKEKKESGKKKESKKKKEEKEDKKEDKKEEKPDQEKLKELQEKYLRLTAEYDNYRKRTLKEKMEISRNAGEDVLQGLLPLMDDFERALQSIDESEDIDAIKEGIHLIYNKFEEVLEQKGVKEIEAKDEEFDTNKHEAISKIPAPSEDMKGKVVDVIQKGYYLNDKILRYAKVVIGE